MKISILTSSTAHPVYPELVAWQESRSDHEVSLHNDPSTLASGDVLFLISCSYIVDAELRSRFGATLIVHASDLPNGRGMSPHVWQILEGESDIVVTLLEAEDVIDTGRIWAQRTMRFGGHELYDEINRALFDATFDLMNEAVDGFDTIEPRAQVGEPSPLYPRRSPDDSRLDPNRSIADQFDLLRVADPDRFPAFFELRGHEYDLVIRKRSTDE